MTGRETIHVGMFSPATGVNLLAVGFRRDGKAFVRPLQGDHCFTGLFWWEGDGIWLGLNDGDQYHLKGVTTIGDVLQFIRLLEGGDGA